MLVLAFRSNLVQASQMRQVPFPQPVRVFLPATKVALMKTSSCGQEEEEQREFGVY